MTITAQLSSALADRYRLERHLGEGGMATVYLAQDLKHDRKVALKVLRPELAAVIGAERFLNEIKVTANLQHPHILPLHDSGRTGQPAGRPGAAEESTANGQRPTADFLYYVMPYVEGDTLRDKLKRERQLDIDEAVTLTRGVAAALDYAHRQGVIHRDIKPENILIHDGQPLVADFGIALAVSHASGQRLTETGLSIGTPHYMSPEQAMGDRELDARSDVYSLGAMLYEMLTGDPPYTGTSAQAIVAKVITEKAPPVTAARDTVPAHVAAAVAKALQKMPADRFRSAADFASALANPAFTSGPSAHQPAGPPAVPPFRRSAVVPALAATAILAAALAAWGWLRSDPAPVTRLDLSLGDIQPVGGELAISADGRMLAVSGTRDGEQAIFVRRLGDADFQKVPGTENGRDPSFSPDGEWLVFRNDAERALVRVAVAGGGTLTLVGGSDFNPFFPHWGTDETIAFLSPGGVHVVSASGGTPRRLGGGLSPHVLPDGSGVLATREGAVHLLPLDGDSAVMLVPDAGHATYVRTGHLLYVAGSGGLFAVPFDLGRHAVTGTPVRVLDRVATGALVPGYWVSRDGTLVHHEGAFGGITFGGGGQPTLLAVGSWEGGVDTLRLPPARRVNPRFSPDGRSIVYESFESARGSQTDIYTFDLVTNTRTQLTFDGDNDDPLWSPDGRRIVYNFANDSTDAEDLWIKPADNSGPAEQVLRRPGDQWPVAWPAADRIVFASVEPAGTDLYLLGTADGATPEPYLQAPWSEVDAAVSPDGTLAAHTSNKNGTMEVWVRDFPTPRGEWRVSVERPGQLPRWSPDGRTLYFLRYGQSGPGSNDTIFAAPVSRTSGVVIQAPEPRFVADIIDWDLHPDGRRFIVALQSAAAEPAAATAAAGSADRRLVVLNWFEELKARVGDK